MTTNKAPEPADASDDLAVEYDLDYVQSRQNRFASRMDRTVTVVLEPDVAAVFGTSESVNRVLRSVISALPANTLRGTVTKGAAEPG